MVDSFEIWKTIFMETEDSVIFFFKLGAKIY